MNSSERASTASAITDEQRTRFNHLKEAHKHMLPLDGTSIRGRDLHALLDIALAAPASRAPAPAAPSAWQPIESVVGSPDDILLLKTTGKQAIETGWYARNLLDDAIREGDTCVYTAWMHLPAAIASSTKALGGTT